MSGSARPAAAAATARARTPEAEALTDLVVRTFRLNGLFLEAGEALARPVGLTAAWWQVLGAVLREPLTVSQIGRHMGLTRQSVQRVADLLVQRGLAEYVANPAHRRAKLLRPRHAGRDAIAALVDEQGAWADRVVADAGVTASELKAAVGVVDRIVEALPSLPAPRTGAPSHSGTTPART